MLSLSVISPEKKIIELECSEITIPTTTGLITVLPEHAPLYSLLEPGEVLARTESKDVYSLVVTRGFISVMNNKVTLLTEFGIKSEDIDEQIVAEAKRKAEEAMKEKVSQETFIESQAELVKALQQLKVAHKRQHQPKTSLS